MGTYYVDTNVIMDFLCDRDSSAYDVLIAGFACEHQFVVSDLVFIELKHQGLEAAAESFFSMGESTKKVSVVSVDEKSRALANKWCDQDLTHYNDAVHAALASAHTDGSVLTKNLADFRRIPGVTPIHPDNI